MNRWCLFMVFALFSCCHHTEKQAEAGSCFSNKVYNKNVIALNDKAMKMFGEELKSGKQNNAHIGIILSLLDSAIEQDSTYFLAYTNKATVLYKVNRPMEAIYTLKRLLRICKDYVEAFEMMGILYDSQGMNSEANACYTNALSLYQKKYAHSKELNSRGNEILMYLLLNNKDSANVLLKNLASEFPESIDEIKEFNLSVSSFDRKQFIESITDTHFPK